jgi:hypothetical protein
VQLTDQELDIHPFVPFNWFFLPEIYNLEFRVPIHHIVSVERKKKFFAECIDIEFTTSDGRNKVSLWLRHPESFVETLRHSSLARGTLPPISTLPGQASQGLSKTPERTEERRR